MFTLSTTRRRAVAAISLPAALAITLAACGGGGSASESTPTAINRIASGEGGGPGGPGGFRPGTPDPNFTPDPDFTPPAGFPGSFNGTPPAGGFRGSFNTPIAEFLGISEDDLSMALQEDGATLASVAEDHGKSRDDVRAFLIEDAEERVAAEVDAGTLTQDEADDEVAMLEAVVDRLLDGSGGPPIMGTPRAQ